MDGIFSDFNVPRNEYLDSIIPSLEKKLKILLQEWICMNLSITPKLHILLNHAIFQLANTRGFADMREDQIERSHQDRMKNDSRLARVQNRNARMNSQAKRQEHLILDKISNIQTDVHKNSKRRRSSNISLKEENDAIRKTKRIKI